MAVQERDCCIFPLPQRWTGVKFELFLSRFASAALVKNILRIFWEF